MAGKEITYFIPYSKAASTTLATVKPLQNKPLFLSVCRTSLLKLPLNERLFVMSYLSTSHSVFFSFGKLSIILIKLKIVICKLFPFESLNYVVWEWVHALSAHALHLEKYKNLTPKKRTCKLLRTRKKWSKYFQKRLLSCKTNNLKTAVAPF